MFSFFEKKDEEENLLKIQEFHFHFASHGKVLLFAFRLQKAGSVWFKLFTESERTLSGGRKWNNKKSFPLHKTKSKSHLVFEQCFCFMLLCARFSRCYEGERERERIGHLPFRINSKNPRFVYETFRIHPFLSVSLDDSRSHIEPTSNSF